jgi:hypothetical protein
LVSIKSEPIQLVYERRERERERERESEGEGERGAGELGSRGE